MEKETFTLLSRYQYTSEALIYKGKLESEGIQVFIRDNNTIDSDPLVSNAIGGVKLFVYTDDFEKANMILSNISNVSLDENNKPIVCPNCGEQKIDMMTSIKDWKSLFSFVFSLLFVLLPLHAKHKYRCDNCKFEFN